MPNMPKNDLGVVDGSGAHANGGYLVYSAMGNHFFGIRNQPTPIYCTPEAGLLSVLEGEKFLPVVGEDGMIHARSRGDTSFLAKLHLKHIEQSGAEVPVDVKLTLVTGRLLAPSTLPWRRWTSLSRRVVVDKSN